MRAVSFCLKEKGAERVAGRVLRQAGKREKVVEIVLRAKERKAEGQAISKFQAGLVVQYRIKARKLARSILRKWHARLDLEEVDSLVDLSLCEAARRFNPGKGASFMTFFYYHLRGNLIRAIHYSATVNTIPVEEEREEFGLYQESDRFGRVCSANEVAEALCSVDYAAPDDWLYKKELIGLSRAACLRLDDLEREVIERIYLQGQQLMDIARSLGYSRCHISRVKRKALETLYDNLTSELASDERPAKPSFSEEDFLARRQSGRVRSQRRPVSVAVKKIRKIQNI